VIDSPTYLLDLTEAMLARLCECLDGTPRGRPADCFISHDQPPHDCCDFLAIWVERVKPTLEFPSEFFGTWRCGDVRPMAEFRALLVRNCWPTVRNNPKSPFPPPEEMDAAASDLLIDGQVLWCCLSSAAADHSLLPPSMDCNEIRLTRMDPVRQADCAGWSIRWVVELDACCEPTPVGS
jgi:hypothetical protein